MFGYTRREVIGKTSAELGINPNPELRARQFAELQQRGSVADAEMKLRTKSGEERTFLNVFGTIEIKGRKHIASYMQDITEPKWGEESLREKRREIGAASGRPGGIAQTRDAHSKRKRPGADS
jgi:PAS domain S-box-containing protein